MGCNVSSEDDARKVTVKTVRRQSITLGNKAAIMESMVREAACVVRQPVRLHTTSRAPRALLINACCARCRKK